MSKPSWVRPPLRGAPNSPIAPRVQCGPRTGKTWPRNSTPPPAPRGGRARRERGEDYRPSQGSTLKVRSRSVRGCVAAPLGGDRPDLEVVLTPRRGSDTPSAIGTLSSARLSSLHSNVAPDGSRFEPELDVVECATVPFGPFVIAVRGATGMPGLRPHPPFVASAQLISHGGTVAFAFFGHWSWVSSPNPSWSASGSIVALICSSRPWPRAVVAAFLAFTQRRVPDRRTGPLPAFLNTVRRSPPSRSRIRSRSRRLP